MQSYMFHASSHVQGLQGVILHQVGRNVRKPHMQTLLRDRRLRNLLGINSPILPRSTMVSVWQLIACANM